MSHRRAESGHQPQQDLLPGLRSTVADSRAKVAATRLRNTTHVEPAATEPVAKVLVDLPLAHLDRPFDYLVPAKFAATARPGVRVKVRFAGQEVDGFVVERAAASEHRGQLTALRRVVGAEPVLSVEVAALSGQVAERYAGARSDVLRLAVPPRHAGAEAEVSPVPSVATADLATGTAAWAEHANSDAFLTHLAEGGSPRAVWSAAPTVEWPMLIAHAVAAAHHSGRGSIVCLPDRRDVQRVSGALAAVLGAESHVVLAAQDGPSVRYRRFLAVSRGATRIVVGTRSAAFAPVHDLGLVVVWDDGDDLHAEPRAPYCHTREILLLRAEHERTAALIGGVARSAEAHYLLRTGWAREIGPVRGLPRQITVRAAGASDTARERDVHSAGARIPAEVHQAIRRGLRDGPVLVQTPRTGYAPALACERCREPARCQACAGPLALGSSTTPVSCRWCGTEQPRWRCAHCGAQGLRAPVVGERRTAEELGRAFAKTLVRSSGGDRVLDTVPDAAAIVVATPGAEPVADGGYAAVAILDTWLTLDRTDLRSGEEAVRRWFNAAALLCPGGAAIVVGDPALRPVQALVRWDPTGFIEREIVERRQAHLPPASRLATITGDPGAVDDALTLLDTPAGAEVLGPVPLGEESRVIVRAPRASGAALSAALTQVQRVRSARKLDAVRIQVDPVALG